MRVLVLSDIHDHLDRLRKALERAGDADALLCCGDLCAPFVVDALAEGFGGPIHIVFGNNDGDPFRIARAADRHGHVTLWGEFAELPPAEFDGRRIALHHFPEVGRGLAESGSYDLVCYGHSHEWEHERHGDTLALNPGEIMGRKGPSTWATYDTETGRAERHEL